MGAFSCQVTQQEQPFEKMGSGCTCASFEPRGNGVRRWGGIQLASIVYLFHQERSLKICCYGDAGSKCSLHAHTLGSDHVTREQHLQLERLHSGRKSLAADVHHDRCSVPISGSEQEGNEA